MKTNELTTVAAALYLKMKNDGYSQNIRDTTQWILGHFQRYCTERGVEDITVPVAVSFLDECFGIDYYNACIPMQTVMRRPLLILFEFEECGNYKKTHQKTGAEIPSAYEGVYLEFRDYINSTPICFKHKEHKLHTFIQFCIYLDGRNIPDFPSTGLSVVHDYLAFQKEKYSPSSISTRNSMLREAFDWLYGNNYISFPGKTAIPTARESHKQKILSYYSKDEIARMLSCIDNTTSSGKLTYSIVCLLAYLGMRVGDVISLQFSNIDWTEGKISYIQQKTGTPVTLPLLEEVKYPLIDYIKNARPSSADKEYVFATLYAPFTRYHKTAPVFRMVGRCLADAGIEFHGRHHGPHALRHSLATSLMGENVPISAISDILGHSSTKTTEAYLTVDETHLKEISLEVPNV